MNPTSNKPLIRKRFLVFPIIFVSIILIFVAYNSLSSWVSFMHFDDSVVKVELINQQQYKDFQDRWLKGYSCCQEAVNKLYDSSYNTAKVAIDNSQIKGGSAGLDLYTQPSLITNKLAVFSYSGPYTGHDDTDQRFIAQIDITNPKNVTIITDKREFYRNSSIVMENPTSLASSSLLVYGVGIAPGLHWDDRPPAYTYIRYYGSKYPSGVEVGYFQYGWKSGQFSKGISVTPIDDESFAVDVQDQDYYKVQIRSESPRVINTNVGQTSKQEPVSTEPTPYIGSIYSQPAHKGDTVNITGSGLNGFEGDVYFFFERADGKTTRLPGVLSEQLNGDAKGAQTAKVTLKEPCQPGQTVYGDYSGKPSICDYVELTPGTYSVYTTPWGKTSNKVPLIIVK